jgi:hypothetical protein
MGQEVGMTAFGLNAVHKNVRKCLQERSSVKDISLNEPISETESLGSRMSLGSTITRNESVSAAPGDIRVIVHKRDGFNTRNRTIFQLAMQEKLLKKHAEDFSS